MAVNYGALFRLDGRRVVVVGAGSGLGRAAAEALAAHGAGVVCADRDEAAAQQVAAAAGGTAVSLDVTDAAAVERAAGELDPVEGLVFTPAMNVRKRLLDYTEDEFARVVGLNLRASLVLIRSFGRRMVSRGAGSIVGFSSIRAATIEPGQGVYAATKAGLEQLSATAAAEFGAAGVRVNVIRPGVVETPLTAQLKANPEWYDAYAQKTALRRWARPEEVAGAVVYLISDAASYVTGSVLTVDGGWTAQDGRYDPPLP